MVLCRGYHNHLCRSTGCILLQNTGRACGGRAAHLPKILTYPGDQRVLTTQLADHFPTLKARMLCSRRVGADIFYHRQYSYRCPASSHGAAFSLDFEISRAFRENKRVILLTTHRRRISDLRCRMFMALRHVLSSHRMWEWFSVHKNPAVRREVAKVLTGIERVY